MNPGRFNHEPSGLVFYRSHSPDRRTRVCQGGQPCADIMNLAGSIMNPLAGVLSAANDWSEVVWS